MTSLFEDVRSHLRAGVTATKLRDDAGTSSSGSLAEFITGGGIGLKMKNGSLRSVPKKIKTTEVEHRCFFSMSSLTGEHEDGLWWTSENELITHGKNDSAAESGRRQFVDHGRVSTVVEEPRVPRRASSGLELVDEVEEVDYEEDADDEVDYEPRSDSERPAQHHPLATECARLECRNEPSGKRSWRAQTTFFDMRT